MWDRLGSRYYRRDAQSFENGGSGGAANRNRHYPRHHLAADCYRAKPYPGRVYLFRAEEREELFRADPKLGWGKILSDLRIQDVPSADHDNIARGGNLRTVAQKLTIALEETSRDLASERTPVQSLVPTAR